MKKIPTINVSNINDMNPTHYMRQNAVQQKMLEKIKEQVDPKYKRQDFKIGLRKRSPLNENKDIYGIRKVQVKY